MVSILYRISLSSVVISIHHLSPVVPHRLQVYPTVSHQHCNYLFLTARELPVHKRTLALPYKDFFEPELEHYYHGVDIYYAIQTQDVSSNYKFSRGNSIAHL